MLERAFSVERYQREISKPTIQGVEHALRNEFSVNLDLGISNPVYFDPRFSTKAEYAFRRTHLVAKEFAQFDIPFEFTLDLPQEDGFSQTNTSGREHFLPHGVITDYFQDPRDPGQREKCSIAALRIYRAYSKLVLDSIPQAIEVSRDPAVTKAYLEEFLKSLIEKATGSDREEQILTYIDELRARFVQGGDLALLTRGVQQELREGQLIIAWFGRSLQKATTAWLAEAALPRFLSYMGNHALWFRQPDSWETSNYEEHFLKPRDQINVDMQRELEDPELLGDPSVMFELFNTKAKSKNSEGHSPEDKVKAKREKKRKRSTPPPPPRQAFPPRHQTPVREPAPPEPLPEVPVRYGGPEPLVFETAEMARLRRVTENRAKREAEREEVSSPSAPAPTESAMTVDQLIAMAFGDEVGKEQPRPTRLNEIVKLADQTIREINPYTYTFMEENILWLTGEEFKMMFEGMPETELESFRNFLLGNMGVENPTKRVNLPDSAFVDYSFPHPTLCLSADTYRLSDEPDLKVRNQAEIRLAIDIVKNAIAASPILRNYPRTDLLIEIMTEGLVDKGESWAQIYPQLNPDQLKTGLEAIWTIIVEDESTEVEVRGMQLISKTKFRSREGEKVKLLPVAGEDLDNAVVRYLTSKIIGRMISEMVKSYPEDQQEEVEVRYLANLAQLEHEPDEFTKVEEFLKNVGIQGYEDAIGHYQNSQIPQLFHEAKAQDPQLVYPD